MKNRLIVIAILVIAIVWGNALIDMRDRRAGVIREAEREISTLALTLEEQVLNSIGATDLALRLIIGMAEENDWTGIEDPLLDSAIQPLLAKITSDVPQVNNLAIVDRDGRFRVQSIGRVDGMSALNREYYLVHRRMPQVGLHISRAVRGQVSGRNVVTISRTIFDVDGDFAGSAVAVINSDYFHKTYTTLDLGANGTIALLDTNGAVINRQPKPDMVVAESFADLPLFTDHLAHAQSGNFVATSPIDGHLRIVSYRHIADTPFIVLVGKSLSETLEPWRREARQTLLTLGAVTLLLIGGCILIVRETTRRQESQQSLEESERRFRSTFDHAPIGIGHLDLHGRWRLSNPALRDILGYSEEEIQGLDFLSLTHPDDRESSQIHFSAMLAGERDVHFTEKRYVRKDGKSIWVHLTASLQKDDKGVPKYILSIVADITSRKTTEADLLGKSEQLRKSEETSRQQALILESIIASMGEAVMVADEHKQFVLFNPAARRLFGSPPDKPFKPEDCIEFFGLRQLDKKTPLSVDEVPLGRALRGEHVDAAEIYMFNSMNPDGAFVSVSARPMTDETGVIRGAVAVCRDITEERLTSEALRQAQKMEAVGQLTGGIAHDFNNLLQVILGNSEILVDVLGENRAHQRFAEMSLMAAQRGAELTSQLLSFSRRQSLKSRPTDVDRLVAETEGLLSGAVGATIEIKQEFAPDLWQALVDPGMLQNAVVNLVLNARDALPHGGRITIHAENFICDQAYASRHKEVPEGEYVRLSVEDTGIGIPAANIDKVFEPFFTTKDVGKGSGLGLSMVYGFVQQSGGGILIRSTEGRGTIVRLYLPRAIVPSITAASPSGTAPKGTETILVAEDDPLVRDFVVSALRSFGYTVYATTNGDSALRWLKENDDKVHLLFTDMVMPGGISGWELAKRATFLRPSLKVLFTSGYTDAAGQYVYTANQTPLLNKPYGKTDLAKAIRRALTSDKELVRS